MKTTKIKKRFEEVYEELARFDSRLKDVEGNETHANDIINEKIEKIKSIKQNQLTELPEKWCVKGLKDSDVHNWFNLKLGRTVQSTSIKPSFFHYPEFESYGLNTCTKASIKRGYTEITLEQFKKWVLDAEQNDDIIDWDKPQILTNGFFTILSTGEHEEHTFSGIVVYDIDNIHNKFYAKDWNKKDFEILEEDHVVISNKPKL